MSDDQLDQRIADLDKRLRRHKAEHHNLQKMILKKPKPNDSGSSELFDAYTQWRYEHPTAARWSARVSWLFLVAILSVSFWSVSSSSVGRALGLESVKNRIVYTYYAGVWAAKVGDQANLEVMKAESYQGYIERVVGDMMVVKIYSNGQQQRRIIKAANVVVQNRGQFKQWAEGFKLKSVRLDFYLVLGQVGGRDVWATVIWLNREPINVQLVEQDIGYPEVSPPTAVVNKLYSLYYWRKAINGD